MKNFSKSRINGKCSMANINDSTYSSTTKSLIILTTKTTKDSKPHPQPTFLIVFLNLTSTTEKFRQDEHDGQDFLIVFPMGQKIILIAQIIF
jgi:hypothetical protein